MFDMKFAKELSDVFGPSGYEHDVAKLIMDNMAEFDVEKDTMQNVYARFKNADTSKPTLMLDAHTDEVGFMVHAVKSNGLLKIIQIGGWVESNIPAHLVWVRALDGKMIRGITSSKPPHFMSAADRAKPLSMDDIFVDVGATSRAEVLAMGIDVGCPIGPEVDFSYNEETGVLFGKSFDNRIGCLCIAETMKKLKDEKLDVNLVGAFATQEEVGLRGAIVTAQTVKPKFAIVFEGSPSDDFIYPPEETQGAMKAGVQIRCRDNGMISHPGFVALARKIATEKGIKAQYTVRTGGSTNAGPIHTSGGAVPTLVLGIPVRYAHTHYCYCAAEDVEAAITLGVAIIKAMDEKTIAEING